MRGGLNKSMINVASPPRLCAQIVCVYFYCILLFSPLLLSEQNQFCPTWNDCYVSFHGCFLQRQIGKKEKERERKRHDYLHNLEGSWPSLLTTPTPASSRLSDTLKHLRISKAERRIVLREEEHEVYSVLDKGRLN